MTRDEFAALVDEVLGYRAEVGGPKISEADRDAILLAGDEYAAWSIENAMRLVPERRPARRSRRGGAA